MGGRGIESGNEQNPEGSQLLQVRNLQVRNQFPKTLQWPPFPMESFHLFSGQTQALAAAFNTFPLLYFNHLKLSFSDDHFVTYRNSKSSYYAPGTNRVLLINYISIKNQKAKQQTNKNLPSFKAWIISFLAAASTKS